MQEQDRSDKQPPESGLDEQAIRDLIAKLDDATPRDGAIVVASDDPDGTMVTANRLGYLRLGVEFLRAGFTDSVGCNDPYPVEVDLEYLFGEEPVCYLFFRDEDVAKTDDAASESRMPAWAGIIGLFLLASLAVGAITIVRWFYGLLS